jgi:hypothetical protein
MFPWWPALQKGGAGGLIRERGGTRPYLGRCEVRTSEPAPLRLCGNLLRSGWRVRFAVFNILLASGSKLFSHAGK